MVRRIRFGRWGIWVYLGSGIDRGYRIDGCWLAWVGVLISGMDVVRKIFNVSILEANTRVEIKALSSCIALRS